MTRIHRNGCCGLYPCGLDCHVDDPTTSEGRPVTDTASTTPEYPEHEKLRAIADTTNAVGDFLEWLTGQGTQLMRFETWTEESRQDCSRIHLSEREIARCAKCDPEGKRIVTETFERWMPERRSIQDLLAECYGIDQRVLEQEKRAILASLRPATTKPAE